MYLLTRSVIFSIILLISSFIFSACNNFKRTPNYKVVLETDMRDVVCKLAGVNSRKDYFIKALRKADDEYYSRPNTNYLDIFIPILQNENTAPLAITFYTLKNSGSSDTEIIKGILEYCKEGIEREIDVLQNRMEENDIEVFSLQSNGTNQIVMNIYTEDSSKVDKLLNANVEMWFYEKLSNQEARNILTKIERAIQRDDSLKKIFTNIKYAEERSRLFVEEDRVDSKKESSSDVPSILISGLGYELDSNQSLIYKMKDTAQVNQIIFHPVINQIIPAGISFYWLYIPGEEYAELLPVYNQNSSSEHWIGGDVISTASLTLMDEKPTIGLEMNNEGTMRWKMLTGRLASYDEHGRIAIIMNNICFLAPTVTGEIPNGKALINGNFALEDAKLICSLINAGSLSFGYRVLEIKAIRDI